MALAHANFSSLFRPLNRAFLQYSTSSSQESLQESILAAIESKTYHKIPDLLNSSKDFRQNPNPFSYLSTLSPTHKAKVIDEILQSFIPIRPRSRPHSALSHLLSHILDTPNPLPLALAVVQRTLRSGCLPVPQTHLLLSNAYILYRGDVKTLLSEMRSIGYSPDCGTCNYLILSLCKVDRLEEALDILRGMGKAGCVPDRDSFGILICRMSELRMIGGVVELVREMVDLHMLSPRSETIVKAVDAMRANREITRAVEMIEFLESKDVDVGFEAYELALEGCLEVSRFVLAGKFAIKMTGRGFIPYIKVRRRVLEGLVGVGETGLASAVRQRFAELNS